jgi:hypothetical protein
MNENPNPNRRKDDARPAVALQWADRPDQWTLLLTGPTSGVIGPLGSTWPNHPAELERVDVCVRRKDGPVAVFRTGGEGAQKWEQFYPYDSIAQPLRDGEYLYREGAAPKLDSIEQYRLQMAAIGTAAIGYWKLGDSITPDYDTQVLRDVAALYGQYDALHRFREQVRRMVRMLKDREWAEDMAATGDAADLQSVITELVGQVWTKARVEELAKSIAESVAKNASTVPQLTFPHIYLGLMDALVLPPRQPHAPDAVEAALTDAAVHGSGAYRVHSDGSTEHVDLQAMNRAAAEIVAFSPPPMVRDALYHDYAVPAKEGPEK